MRLSSAFALAVLVASASSVSAIDDSADHCPIFCKITDNAHCKHCLAKICVSFSGLLPARKFGYVCLVSPSRVSAFAMY
ncbi:hypothetical protein EDD22DRAFT_902447 [Suillus occidentalis]|nr:hypothetical protein EDD22DRAFT_902447 [Suillus occidentalis]